MSYRGLGQAKGGGATSAPSSVSVDGERSRRLAELDRAVADARAAAADESHLPFYNRTAFEMGGGQVTWFGVALVGAGSVLALGMLARAVMR